MTLATYWSHGPDHFFCFCLWWWKKGYVNYVPLAENRLLTDSIKAGSAIPIGGQSTINRLHKMANGSSPDPFPATRNKME